VYLSSHQDISAVIQLRNATNVNDTCFCFALFFDEIPGPSKVAPRVEPPRKTRQMMTKERKEPNSKELELSEILAIAKK